jgi:hypothetical protein
MTLYLTNYYLETQFHYKGEALYKGAGHLLSENFTKGIIYLSTFNLFTTVFLTITLLIYFIDQYASFIKKIVHFIIFTIIFLTIAYLLFEKNNIINGFISVEKIIENILTWNLRALGIYIGYLICLKFTSKSK